MGDEKRWMMFLTVRTGEDDVAAARMQSEIGYRGLTQHATKEDAEAAAKQMLAAAVAAAPGLRWMAVWAKPWLDHRPNDEEAGHCYGATLEPDRGG